MNCLFCQLPLSECSIPDAYHAGCARKLFGTSSPPAILFSTIDISIEAQRMAGKMSVSGVQPKLSLIHDPKKKRMAIVKTGGRYILKPQTDRFPLIPENENLCMLIAGDFGIETPPHGLIPLADKRPAYIIRRFDRLHDGTKLHLEDFQQLLEKEDKYDGSYEQIAGFIKAHSTNPGTDLIKLFDRSLLFFVLGNGDAHLKNFSLIRTEVAGYHLSPAYDIVNSRLVIPEEREEMSLSIQGKRNKITKNDFFRLAAHFGLNEKIVFNTFERLFKLQAAVEQRIEQSFLPIDYQQRFIGIFHERMKRITVQDNKHERCMFPNH